MQITKAISLFLWEATQDEFYNYVIEQSMFYGGPVTHNQTKGPDRTKYAIIDDGNDVVVTIYHMSEPKQGTLDVSSSDGH